MASIRALLTFRMVLRDIKAAKALIQAYESVSEIAADQPWNEDAKRAKRLLRRAVRGLATKPEGK